MVMPIDQSFNNIVTRQSTPDEPVYSRRQRAVDIPHLKSLEEAAKNAPQESRKTAIEELQQAKEEMATALAEERVMTMEQTRAVIDALMANYGRID